MTAKVLFGLVKANCSHAPQTFVSFIFYAFLRTSKKLRASQSKEMSTLQLLEMFTLQHLAGKGIGVRRICVLAQMSFADSHRVEERNFFCRKLIIYLGRECIKFGG